MLGDEIGVLAQAIARSFDLDHHGVVQEPIEKGGGDDRIAEHLAPLRIASDAMVGNGANARSAGARPGRSSMIAS